jgi:glutamate decarboxylase
MADMLLADLRRQLPRLERQPSPVHDEASAAGFRH